MIEVRPKGCINELNFGYNTKMEGYTNSSPDIPKLYAILGLLIIGRHKNFTNKDSNYETER